MNYVNVYLKNIFKKILPIWNKNKDVLILIKRAFREKDEKIIPSLFKDSDIAELYDSYVNYKIDTDLDTSWFRIDSLDDLEISIVTELAITGNRNLNDWLYDKHISIGNFKKDIVKDNPHGLPPNISGFIPSKFHNGILWNETIIFPLIDIKTKITSGVNKLKLSKNFVDEYTDFEQKVSGYTKENALCEQIAKDWYNSVLESIHKHIVTFEENILPQLISYSEQYLDDFLSYVDKETD